MLTQLSEHFKGGSPVASQFTFRDPDSNRVYNLESRESSNRLGYADALTNDPNVAMLLQSLSPANLVSLLASVLFERRVIVVSELLGRATGCCIGVERLCHPISWEGVYITIMPNHLLDYCSAPMPFLVGLHSSNWKVVESMPLDEHVLVLADEDKVITPFNDFEVLPSELASKLKAEFKHAQSTAKKAKRPPIADERLRDVMDNVIYKLIGDFREHIRRVPDRRVAGKSTVEIDVDSFISSKPKAYHRARALLASSQSLRSFVDQRIDEICAPVTAKPRRMSIGASSEGKATAIKSANSTLRRRKSVKTASHIKEFLATRPDLQDQGDPYVFKAIWLGGSQVDGTHTSTTVGEHLVKTVLDRPVPPRPVLVMVFCDTVVVTEDKTFKVRNGVREWCDSVDVWTRVRACVRTCEEQPCLLSN
jgi:hypothetical protein